MLSDSDLIEISRERSLAQSLREAEFALAAGAEIDRLKLKTRHQRIELAKLNKRIHEHRSRADAKQAKVDALERELSYRELQVEQLQAENLKYMKLLKAYGAPNVSTY